MSELEIVRYGHIQGMSVFFNIVEYRTSHFHKDWELIWVVDNPMKISAGTERFVAEPGQVVLFPPSMVHEFQAVDKACTCLVLQVSPLFINVKDDFVTSSIHPFDFMKENKIKKVKEMLCRIIEAYLKKNRLYQLYCSGLCNLLMYDIISKMPSRTKTVDEINLEQKNNERLNRLIEFVNENYMHKVLLSKFAQQEDLTMNYLSHFVREKLNRSFQSYVNTVRFHAACNLIARNEFKLTDICKMAGFSDYKYFSKTFRENCHMSPEEYSNQIQKDNEVHIIQHNINSSEKRLDIEESLLIIERESGR